MKSILLYLFFFILLLYFINGESLQSKQFKKLVKAFHTDPPKEVERQCSAKTTTTSYQVTKSLFGEYFIKKSKKVKYNVEKELDSELIYEAWDLTSRETCFKFINVSYTQDPDIIRFKYGNDCGVDIITKQKQFFFAVYLNKDCMDLNFIRKLILKVIILRDDIVKLIEMDESKHTTDILWEEMVEITDEKYCTYDRSSKQLSITTSSSHSPSNHIEHNFTTPKYDSILIDANVRLTYFDLKEFNMRFCNHTCDALGHKSCQNNAFHLPTYCFGCFCPRFYFGPHCEQSLIKKNEKECGKHVFILPKDKSPPVFQFQRECFYRVDAPYGYGIKIHFSFGYSVDIDCKGPPIMEIWLNGEIYKGGFYPCGTMQFFDIPTQSNQIWLYFGEAAQELHLSLTFYLVPLNI